MISEREDQTRMMQREAEQAGNPLRSAVIVTGAALAVLLLMLVLG